jgi:hypothetical protein
MARENYSMAGCGKEWLKKNQGVFTRVRVKGTEKISTHSGSRKFFLQKKSQRIIYLWPVVNTKRICFTNDVQTVNRVFGWLYRFCFFC